MGTTSIISVFILGFICGIISLIACALAYGQYIILKKTKILQQKAKIYDSAKEKLDKVREITQQQFDMQSNIEQPQKNALDGKFKNGLTHEVKRLEEEKRELLQSILNDGIDPELSVLDENGELKNMKLSELMAQMGISVPTTNNSIPPTTDVKRVGRFLVHEGGKISQNPDDSGGNSTTH